MRMHCRTYFFSLFYLVIGLSAFGARSQVDYQTEVLASGLDHPWSIAVIDDGRILITERSGQLLLWENGKVTNIEGLPEDIYVAGQGGLQDIRVHPQYPQKNWLYLSYAAGTDECNQLKVIRARLEGNQLLDTQPLLAVEPCKDTPVHYGARMTFLPDHSLLVTTGDGFDYREDAQRLSSQLGKVLRITDTGEIPESNPFYRAEDPNTRMIFSVGHRNPQGLVYDPLRQVVFAHEHGPAGGDEVNLIHSGQNYGWPIVTLGRDYSGARISPFETYPGMQAPLVNWTPSIAPSGLAIYRGEMFEEMQGDLLIGTLKTNALQWVDMEGLIPGEQRSLLTELEQRIRDVRIHPDGSILLLTDAIDGQLVRVFRDSASKD